jgi:hypothetical protein
MILINCNKHGFVKELSNSDNYEDLISIINSLIEEYESRGIMLISDTTNESLARTLEFASIENGWECALILAHGYASNTTQSAEDND